MSSQVIDSLLGFMEKEIHRYKLMDITWFGGEPLVEWEILVAMSEQMMRLCRSHGCTYSSTIITNGYLLDEGRISRLHELGIRSIVTSLDGPPHIHNARRPLADGMPTIDRILKNLKSMTRMGCRVTVQVNCDSSTIEYTPQLLDILGDVRKEIILHFRWLFPSNAEKYSCAVPVPNADQEILRLNRMAVLRGFQIRNPSVWPRWAYCNTDYENHWLIDPNGEVFKCSIERELHKPVGRLLPNGRLWFDHERLAKWLAKDPFSRQECRDCPTLPTCLGGCAFAFAARGQPRCVATDGRLVSEYILLQYLQNQVRG